jgi:3',5'-cyclic AMP phosphodiesterase CpdA
MDQLAHVQVAGSAGRPLRVLQLTDLHEWPTGTVDFQKAGTQGYKLADYGYNVDKNDALTASLLERLKPDLVILTGDIIDSRPLIGQGPDSWREPFGKVIQPLIEANVPWTFVPGNHDVS